MKDPVNVVVGFLLFISVTSVIVSAISIANERTREPTSVTVMGTQVVVMSPEPGVTCYLRGMNGIFCMKR